MTRTRWVAVGLAALLAGTGWFGQNHRIPTASTSSFAVPRQRLLEATTGPVDARVHDVTVRIDVPGHVRVSDDGRLSDIRGSGVIERDGAAVHFAATGVLSDLALESAADPSPAPVGATAVVCGARR